MIDKEVNVIKKLSPDYRLENFGWETNNLLIEKFKVTHTIILIIFSRFLFK